MCVCSGVFIYLEDLSPYSVTEPPRKHVHPEDVVDTTEKHAVLGFLCVSDKLRGQKSPALDEGVTIEKTYIPIPTTQYVAYQKLTAPAYGPPLGGNQGMTKV